MATRARPGDVLGASTHDGTICMEYLGKHAEYGDAILVCPVMQRGAVVVGPELFREGYVAFYPVNAALARRMVTVIGHLAPAGMPARLRRAGVRSGRGVETWVIEGPTGEELRTKLSDEELHFPIAAIWNHELLLQRVTEGWRPETEGIA